MNDYAPYSYSPGQPATPRQAAIMQALGGQRRRTSFSPYFSRVKFESTRSATPFIYTVAANLESRAFGYQLGGDMAAGGYIVTTRTATKCDTNIITAGRTIGGQAVEISGISVQVLSSSAAELVTVLWPELSVVLSLNGGENAFLLGTPAMLPGSSGLYGAARNSIGEQAIAGGRPNEGYITNGLPGLHNQAAIPEGLIWYPEGEQDSTLNIIFRSERAAATHNDGIKNDEAAAAGIRGYTFPTAAQAFVEILVRLHGAVVGPRSRVA